jgi:hypothetical protein
VADVDPAPKGRQRCKACGGPRLVLNAGHFQLSGAERTSLLLARRALLRSGLWKTLGVILGALGGFSLLVAGATRSRVESTISTKPGAPPPSVMAMLPFDPKPANISGDAAIQRFAPSSR